MATSTLLTDVMIYPSLITLFIDGEVSVTQRFVKQTTNTSINPKFVAISLNVYRSPMD